MSKQGKTPAGQVPAWAEELLRRQQVLAEHIAQIATCVNETWDWLSELVEVPGGVQAPVPAVQEDNFGIIDPEEGDLGKPLTSEMLRWRQIVHKVFGDKPVTLAVVGGRHKQDKRALDRIRRQSSFDGVIHVPVEAGRHTRCEETLRQHLRKGKCRVAALAGSWLSPDRFAAATKIAEDNGIKVIRVGKPTHTQALVKQLLECYDKHRVARETTV